MKHENVIYQFENHASNNPKAIALIEEGSNVSYSDLRWGMNKIASYLIENDSGKNKLCFVMVETTHSSVIAMLGSMKSGSVYVPIDKRSPDAFILNLIKDYGPDWLIYDEKTEEKANGILEKAENISIKSFLISPYLLLNGNPRKEDFSNLTDFRFEENHACYLFFTSGTTGNSKGILGTFKGLNHFIDWESQYLQLHHGFRVSQLSPFTFDVFLRDVFLPLCNGGTICVPPRKMGLIDIRKLTKWLNDLEINVMHCVPTIFREIIQNAIPKTINNHLRYILLAGEKLFWKDISNWNLVFDSNTELLNIYGPSETSLAKFVYPIGKVQKNIGVVPIGKPIDGCKAIILDEHLNPVKQGNIGEIFIRTEYASLGYYKNQKLTDSKFITHPLIKSEPKIIYKTGDLAKINNEGDFEFVGRKDNQIKIKGVRIELESIENILVQSSSVSNAVVIYDEKSDQIVAFVINSENQSAQDIKMNLFNNFPTYMIPARIIAVDKFPLNKNGKVNRKALTKELSEKTIKHSDQIIQPTNKQEEEIRSIWSSILEVPKSQIGVEDNFFEVGGHSLKLLALSEQIEAVFNRKIDMMTFFKYPTIKKFCQYMNDVQPMTKDDKRFDNALGVLENSLKLLNDEDNNNA